jgi:hypothetical protein
MSANRGKHGHYKNWQEFWLKHNWEQAEQVTRSIPESGQQAWVLQCLARA